jgi:hypothetical protein
MGMYFSRRLPAGARGRSGRCAKSTRRRRVPRRVRPSEIRAFHPSFVRPGFIHGGPRFFYGLGVPMVIAPRYPYPLYPYR